MRQKLFSKWVVWLSLIKMFANVQIKTVGSTKLFILCPLKVGPCEISQRVSDPIGVYCLTETQSHHGT